jgi:hypothetical protein
MEKEHMEVKLEDPQKRNLLKRKNKLNAGYYSRS